MSIFLQQLIMEGGRALMDASSYVLIEASGDSESEYYHAAAEEEAELGVAAAVEDDAESCSCGSLSGCAVVHETDGGSGGGDVFLDGCVEDYGDDDDDVGDGGCGTTEVEDGVVDQCCGGGGAAASKSKGCEDSNMNERDRDRLFWEACLAS